MFKIVRKRGNSWRAAGECVYLTLHCRVLHLATDRPSVHTDYAILGVAFDRDNCYMPETRNLLYINNGQQIDEPFTWVTIRPEVVYIRRSGSVQIQPDRPLISVRARIGSNSTSGKFAERAKLRSNISTSYVHGLKIMSNSDYPHQIWWDSEHTAIKINALSYIWDLKSF